MILLQALVAKLWPISCFPIMGDQKGKGLGKNGQCHWIPWPQKPGKPCIKQWSLHYSDIFIRVTRVTQMVVTEWMTCNIVATPDEKRSIGTRERDAWRSSALQTVVFIPARYSVKVAHVWGQTSILHVMSWEMRGLLTGMSIAVRCISVVRLSKIRGVSKNRCFNKLHKSAEKDCVFIESNSNGRFLSPALNNRLNKSWIHDLWVCPSVVMCSVCPNSDLMLEIV